MFQIDKFLSSFFDTDMVYHKKRFLRLWAAEPFKFQRQKEI